MSDRVEVWFSRRFDTAGEFGSGSHRNGHGTLHHLPKRRPARLGTRRARKPLAYPNEVESDGRQQMTQMGSP